MKTIGKVGVVFLGMLAVVVFIALLYSFYMASIAVYNALSGYLGFWTIPAMIVIMCVAGCMFVGFIYLEGMFGDLE